MAKLKLKYTIQDLLQQLPKSITTKHVTNELEQKHGIAERTFHSDKAIKANQKRDVPTTRLRVYAKFFGVELEELFNTDVKNVKSIFESTSKSRIKNDLS
jgi:hypothetical protein